MLHKASPVLKAAASPDYLAKGCVNVVELGNLKEQAGARWPRIREGVYARIETLLRDKLGPNDLFVRLGDIAYLVTMPTTDPEDVSAICMRVAFDLHMTFLGQCGLDQIEVNTVTSIEDDTLVLQKLPFEKVVGLAEKAGIAVSPAERAGQAARESHRAKPISHTSAGGKAPKAIGPAFHFDEPPPRALIVEFQFVPIWSVRNSAVTTYACEPKTIVDAAARRVPISLVHLTPKERIQIDVSAFQTGINQLVKCHEAGNKFLLAVPISFEVLGTPAARMDFLSACRDLSYNYRNFLTFILVDVPPGVAQSRLANMATILRPFGRSVSATIAPTDRAFGSYQGIGLHSIGFELREFGPRTPFSQKDTEQLAQFARKSNLGTFLSNVQDRNILKYAQDASIANLSGPIIAPASPEPRGMWRLSWTETLSQPVVEIWD
jgi:hypothetical protein